MIQTKNKVNAFFKIDNQKNQQIVRKDLNNYDQGGRTLDAIIRTYAGTLIINWLSAKVAGNINI